jgi:hypothetical protein
VLRELWQGYGGIHEFGLGAFSEVDTKPAKELQGKDGDEVKQFGPAAWDVGSGLGIQQRDV